MAAKKKIAKKVFNPKKLPTDTDVIMPGYKYPKGLLDAVNKAKKPKKKISKKR